jgi:hypothetical protein
MLDEERAIQFLKYNLWDVERSILETPGTWRYLYIEEKGSLPADDEAIARKIYDFAVKKKLERVKGSVCSLRTFPLQMTVFEEYV